jgi:hypothetical protein
MFIQPENSTLRRLRGGLSRANLAARFEILCNQLRRDTKDPLYRTPSRSAIEKQIYRLEKGVTRYPDELYKQLYCRYFGVSAHDLFGDLDAEPEPSDGSGFSLNNHKLIPMYVGPDAAQSAVQQLGMSQCDDQCPSCHSITVPHPRGLHARLWAWPFGVALFQIVESVTFPSLADLAIWHRRVYDEQMAWVNACAARLLDIRRPNAQYAMPVNFLTRSIWDEAELPAALRVLAMPRLLLKRDAGNEQEDLSHARMVERSLLRDGFTGAHVAEFGVRGDLAGCRVLGGGRLLPGRSNSCPVRERDRILRAHPPGFMVVLRLDTQRSRRWPRPQDSP